MNKTLTILALIGALAAAGCAPVMEAGLPGPVAAGALGSALDAAGVRPPAPGRATVIDDQALLVALAAADTTASAVDALVASGYLVPGTPRALAVRDALVRLRSLLRAASAAQRAGEAQTYARALADAAGAAQDISRALRA